MRHSRWGLSSENGYLNNGKTDVNNCALMRLVGGYFTVKRADKEPLALDLCCARGECNCNSGQKPYPMRKKCLFLYTCQSIKNAMQSDGVLSANHAQG